MKQLKQETERPHDIMSHSQATEILLVLYDLSYSLSDMWIQVYFQSETKIDQEFSIHFFLL